MQRYAMLLGTYMGGYWILIFVLFVLELTAPILSFLFIGLVLCVPFMGYRYVRMYRDKVCGSSIGFLHAWLFTVFMYMYAALLASVAYYIYFRFIDNGLFISVYESRTDAIVQSNIPEFESLIDISRETLNTLKSLSPIDITLQLLSANVLWGALLAIPTALFAIKRPPAGKAAE